MVFIFFFFCFSVQATVLSSEQDIFKLDKSEVRNPYTYLIPFPFTKDVVKKANLLLDHKNLEVMEYTKALQVFYHLNSKQISLILNERTLLVGMSSNLNKISTNKLNQLYKNPEVKEIVDFILENELSSKQILIFIFPFLKNHSLKSDQIIQVLNSVSFDVNTLLKTEDLISVFMDSSFSTKKLSPDNLIIKSTQDLFMPDSKELLESLKQFQSLFSDKEIKNQTLSSNFNETDISEHDVIKQFKKSESDMLFPEIIDYYKPEVVIGSLAHFAMAYRQEGLIKFLYKNKNFNPNILNHIDQTPLHSLFIFSESSDLSSLDSETVSQKDWERLLGIILENSKVNWNATDIHGLTPLAVAISKSLTEALPVLFDIKGIDISIKDNYNRSLVIIASQSLSQESKKNFINILIKKGGDQLVMPSHFNDYIDEQLNPITIEYNHPLRDVIYHAFSIIKENKNQDNEMVATLADYDYKLRQSLQVKKNVIESINQAKGSYYQQPVVQAIKKDDSQFFEKFYLKSSDITDFIEHIFIFPVKNPSKKTEFSAFLENIDYIPSYHLLLLAIKENSPRVVQFFLENINNPYHFQPDKNDLSLYMDILSEALIQSLRIYFDNLSSSKNLEREQRKNDKIIEAVISNKKVDLEFRNFMDLTPMEIAFLTGQVEKMKALQTKDISLPKGDLWDTGISYLDIVDRQGFKQAGDYFRKINRINSSSCYSNFIN